MTNLKKVKDVLSLVVTAATAMVALAEIWNKIGPDVKKVIQPVIDGCKKIAPMEPGSVPVVIEE